MATDESYLIRDLDLVPLRWLASQLEELMELQKGNV
jgi:hypothetical protein